MLKALIKKQLLEIKNVYFRRGKKKQSKKNTVLIGVLMGVLTLYLMGIFFLLSYSLGTALCPNGLDWLYFSIMGFIALLFGVFGSVFNTYATLYNAKDNDLLLSMPISPSKILFSKLLGVFIMGIIFELIVMLPVLIAYYICATVTFASVVFSLLLLFILGIVILTLSCFFGWIVALLSARLKNKGVLTLIITVVFIGLYMFLCFNFTNFMESITANVEEFGNKIKTFAYPFYIYGRANSGELLPMIFFTLAVLSVFGITYLILTKTFLKLATKKTPTVKKEYSVNEIKAGNYKKALFKKEFKRFTSSPTYMLNAGFGVIFLPVIGVLALIFGNKAISLLEEMSLTDILPTVACFVICALISTIDITASSVSLEGKSLAVLKSLPVNSKDILSAKRNLQLAISIPPSAFAAICLDIAFNIEFATSVIVIGICLIYNVIIADFGLVLNLKHPNFEWTNETIVVKQGLSVTLSILTGLGISILFAVLGIISIKFMSVLHFLLTVLIVSAILARYLSYRLLNNGAKTFDNL